METTARSYLNSLEFPVIFWTSAGVPNGTTIAHFEETAYSFDLDPMEGTVKNDRWEWNGQSKSVDWNRNSILLCYIYSNEEVYKQQKLEIENEVMW